MNKLELKYGTDPELFVINEKLNGLSYDRRFIEGVPFAFVPFDLETERLIKVIHEDPKHPVYFSTSTGNVIGDGVALEINLKTPFLDPLEMVSTVKDIISKFETAHSLHLKALPTINFDYLGITDEKIEDTRYLMSVIFGCDPDENSYDETYSCDILDARTHPHRYGGGHIHISNIGEAIHFPRIVAKLLSFTVGNYVNANTQNRPLVAARAAIYGNPGKYRFQSYKDGTYGIEYRSPSNEWLTFSDDKLKMMFKWAEAAINMFYNSDSLEKDINDLSPETFIAMSTCDTSLSNEILKSIERFLV